MDAHEALSLGLIDGIVSASGNDTTSTSIQQDEVKKFVIDFSSMKYQTNLTEDNLEIH